MNKVFKTIAAAAAALVICAAPASSLINNTSDLTISASAGYYYDNNGIAYADPYNGQSDTFVTRSGGLVYKKIKDTSHLVEFVGFSSTQTSAVVDDQIIVNGIGYNVAGIGDEFSFNKTIKSLDFSEVQCLEEIPAYAFAHSSIEEVILPPNLRKIDSSAFFDCDNLKEIYIPEDTNSIGSYAFRGCDSLKVLYLEREATSRRVLSIGTKAFAECKALSLIVNNAPLVSGESDAFNGCTSKALLVDTHQRVANAKEKFIDAFKAQFNIFK